MPPLTGVLETSLYVEDVERSARFYQDLFGFPPLELDPTFAALSVCDRHVLLLFRHGSKVEPAVHPGGVIPPHDGAGRLHLAFSIPPESLDAWQERLGERSVPVESVYLWPRGGRSIYFRDPDGHLVELVTPGCWAIY